MFRLIKPNKKSSTGTFSKCTLWMPYFLENYTDLKDRLLADVFK